MSGTITPDWLAVLLVELVVAYEKEYSRFRLDPIDMLNQHIKAFIKSESESKEAAILDLALRHGIEIHGVKELMDKGIPRSEAIFEVSKRMKIDVEEDQLDQWLRRSLRRLRQEKERKDQMRVARLRLEKEREERERQMTQKLRESKERAQKSFEKAVELLTSLLFEEIISEESYRTAVRTLEEKRKRAELEPKIFLGPILHIEKAHALFIKDIKRRKNKIKRFEEKYGVKLRTAKTLKDAIEKLSGVRRSRN